MTDQSREKAWGFAIFCDDVRPEVGGKLSLMGLYQADMFFPASISLPIILPKFFAVINYYEIHHSIEEDMIFRITYGTEGAALAELPISRKEIQANQIAATAAPEDAEDQERIFNIRLPIPLIPFTLSKMGRLRVRAHYSDGKVLRLGSMAIRQIPDAEFQAMTGIVAAP
ncbi:hypothetical protein AAFG07_17660 [Bradyrhizobium sp. B097]|uniref:hypothetical protein n=1 Tax=Bradyrhizobium sp. B097 TaxID=3140244 RepID=UPI003182D7C3